MTVDPKVLKSSQARAYFISNGYHHPDLSAEVFERVLPKYRKTDTDVLFRTHALHLRKILRVLKDAKVGAHLLEQLRTIRVVLCSNPVTQQQRFCLPGEAYFWDAGLGSYFGENPNVWFVADEYTSVSSAGSIHKLFRKLGVTSEFPRETCGARAYAIHCHGYHERGIAGFHPEWNVDGLDFVTAHPTIEGAAFIWNNLLPRFENQISGKVQSSTRQDFPAHYTREQLRVSPGGALLRGRAWIPDSTGAFRTGNRFLLSMHFTTHSKRTRTYLQYSTKGRPPRKVRLPRPWGAVPRMQPSLTKTKKSTTSGRKRSQLAEQIEKCLSLVRQRTVSVDARSSWKGRLLHRFGKA